MAEKFHTIVIGAGSGGLTVAIGLAALGKPVALVEAKHIGGDCTNVGCIPSKTLIHLASGKDVSDGAAIMARVQARRNALRERETGEVGHLPNLTLVRGRAALTEKTAAGIGLSVAGADGSARDLVAPNVVIATGSRPRRLEIPGLPAALDLTNESIFELAAPPKHLVILGAGVIAVELACAFRKLGSQVTLLMRGERILSSAIPEASAALAIEFERQGIRALAHASAHSYDAQTQSLSVRVGDSATTLTGVDAVLQAVGRERNLAGLGLERLGVAFDAAGIHTDSFGRTNVPGLFAIGDVTSTAHTTHAANAQGRRVSQAIALPFLPSRAPEPAYPEAIFCDPEVASVGLPAAQIRSRYHSGVVIRVRVDFKDIDRGYTDEAGEGFVIIDAIRLTGSILAATVVGPRASELIAALGLAISKGVSLHGLYRQVYPYPTYSSGIGKAADAFIRATLPPAKLKGELLSYLRYRLARPV